MSPFLRACTKALLYKYRTRDQGAAAAADKCPLKAVVQEQPFDRLIDAYRPRMRQRIIQLSAYRQIQIAEIKERDYRD